MIHNYLGAFLAALAFSKNPPPWANLTTLTKIPFLEIAELELDFHYRGKKAA